MKFSLAILIVALAAALLAAVIASDEITASGGGGTGSGCPDTSACTKSCKKQGYSVGICLEPLLTVLTTLFNQGPTLQYLQDEVYLGHLDCCLGSSTPGGRHCCRRDNCWKWRRWNRQWMPGLLSMHQKLQETGLQRWNLSRASSYSAHLCFIKQDYRNTALTMKFCSAILILALAAALFAVVTAVEERTGGGGGGSGGTGSGCPDAETCTKSCTKQGYSIGICLAPLLTVCACL
ncbi:hypothetical protein MRX96_035783 [Rhipicephalus microplus]